MFATTNIHHSVAADFIANHLAETDLRRARIRQLEDDICELAAHMDAAMFRWLELLREFDECDGWAGDGIRSCAHWLNWKCGLALGAASLSSGASL